MQSLGLWVFFHLTFPPLSSVFLIWNTEYIINSILKFYKIHYKVMLFQWWLAKKMLGWNCFQHSNLQLLSSHSALMPQTQPWAIIQKALLPPTHPLAIMVSASYINRWVCTPTPFYHSPWIGLHSFILLSNIIINLLILSPFTVL